MTEKQVINGIIGRDCSSFMAPFRKTISSILLFSFILYALALHTALSLLPFSCSLR
jgi:hypothetical protein